MCGHLGEGVSESRVPVSIHVVEKGRLEGGGGGHEGKADSQQLPATQQAVALRVLRRLPAQLHIQLVTETANINKSIHIILDCVMAHKLLQKLL